MSAISRACVVASMFLSLGGCQARLQANARSSTTSGSEANASAQSNTNNNANTSSTDHRGHDHGGSGSSASFHAQGSASGSVHVHGRGEGNASGQARGQGNGQGNGGGGAQPTPPSTRPERPREVDHARGATAGQRVITYTAPPRIEIKPAKQPPPFRGRVMPARRRAGHARRPQTPTTPAVETPATPAVTPPTTPTTPVAETPTTPAPSTPVAEPTPQPEPQPPAAPVPPPEAPPENVFGYEQPVLGCFEGQVYFIEANSQRLPRSYDDLESSAVLYACEWDIPTRAWEQGFPGLSDRFEWFAIRYAGAFSVTKAGKYRFHMSSDDGGKVTIDGRVVIDNDGVHPPQDKSGEVRLSAGDHTMVIEYFQGPRYHINLQLFVTPPDGEEGIFSVRPQ